MRAANMSYIKLPLMLVLHALVCFRGIWVGDARVEPVSIDLRCSVFMSFCRLQWHLGGDDGNTSCTCDIRFHFGPCSALM